MDFFNREGRQGDFIEEKSGVESFVCNGEIMCSVLGKSMTKPPIHRVGALVADLGQPSERSSTARRAICALGMSQGL